MHHERMNFGKHRGKPLPSVPGNYLHWCLNECQGLDDWLRAAIERELQSRDSGPPRPPEHQHHGQGQGGRQLVDVRSLVQTWYREMALRFHPDRGGSHEAMKVINHAHERLKLLANVA
jgi:hypothetical protein